VKQPADLDAAPDEVFTRHVNVGNDEFQALNGSRLGSGDAFPEGNRAL
jgi:hypothetical protein